MEGQEAEHFVVSFDDYFASGDISVELADFIVAACLRLEEVLEGLFTVF